MKYFLALLSMTTILAGVSVGGVWGQSAKEADLSTYRWRNRLLLVFGPSADLPAYQQYRQELVRQRPSIEERDLIVFRIFDQGQSFRGDAPLAPEAAISLRQRFGVRGAGPRVVLIGKDGGVKLDQAAFVPLAEIFALIDSMPMRRREMKERP